MPMLLRGMARTAVVAGTATAVSGRVSRRQNQRWAEQEQQAQPQQYQEPPPQPMAAPSAEDDRDRQIAQLKELADLKTQGILTEEEFAAQKAEILGG
jgi:hypothetical protein